MRPPGLMLAGCTSFRAPGFSGGSDATLASFQQPPNGGPAAGSWLFTLREAF